MAQLNITVNPRLFYTTESVVSTECSNVYTINIYSINGNNIDITLIGDATNSYLISNGVTLSPFVSTTSITFNNTLVLKFAVLNSNLSGTFLSVNYLIEDTTLVDSSTNTVTREDDSSDCEPFIQYYVGEYTSLANLQADNPSPIPGNYGQVDAGIGTDVVRYVWDNTDSQWISIGSNATNTSELINDGESGVSTYVELQDIDTYAELDAIVADETLAKHGDNLSDFVNDPNYITETALPTNTVVRGLQGVILTKANFISFIIPEAGGVFTSQQIADGIKNFSVNGDTITCLINLRYTFANDVFRPTFLGEDLTHWYDYDGRCTIVGDQSFLLNTNIVELILPNMEGDASGIFNGNSSMTKLIAPKVTNINLLNCSALNDFDLRGLTTLGTLQNCSSLPANVTGKFDSVRTLSGQDGFKGTVITTADFPNVTTMGSNYFRDWTAGTNIKLPKLASYSGMRNANSITSLYLPECTIVTATARAFENDGLNLFYAPNCVTFGNDATTDDFFTGATVSGMVIVVNEVLRTSNAGDINANLAQAISLGVNVYFAPTYAESQNRAFLNVSAAYTIRNYDSTVNATANTFAITLLTAVGRLGKAYTIKNSGTGVITINTTSSQTIDGAASGSIILSQYEGITVQSDGANWIIIEA